MTKMELFINPAAQHASASQAPLKGAGWGGFKECCGGGGGGRG